MQRQLRLIGYGVITVIILAAVFVAIGMSDAAPSWMKIGQEEAYSYNGGFYEPPKEAHELVNAVDQNGDPFSFADYEGKTIFVYFGYTNCPDACPATLAEWREVDAVLGDKGDDVVYVMVTVDPERDTPQRLKEWLSFWDPSFFGVSMSVEDTDAVKLSWGIRADKREGGSASGYLVDHDVSTYVIGPDGKLHLTYPLGFDPEDIAEDILHLQTIN